MSQSITPESLLELPISTFVAVIGCGDPALIDAYAALSNCPFPIYADPTRALYTALGLARTLRYGEKPAYASKSLAQVVFSGIAQGIKNIPSGRVTKGGDGWQVGGEFMFEPVEDDDNIGANADGETGIAEVEKMITWCHRMRTTRDHCEIPELREVLGMDGSGVSIKDQKLWKKALETRKGTGSTMAGKMGEMLLARKARVSMEAERAGTVL